MKFVHLHVHSHYSLLDGAIPVGKLVKAAAEYEMPALALTDHGNMFGAIQFYRACKGAGIKPIIGMEAYVAPGSRFEKKKTAGGAFFHFLLLARNEEGYRNLMRLSSLAYLEGFYYKPRIDKELLAAHSGGLIGSSACLSSEINRAALSGADEDIRTQIEAYRDIFDPGCFYLEIQRNGLQEQERILEKIPPLAKEFGLPMIATNDVHYLRRQDSRAQEVHLCINTGQTMDDADRMCFSSDQFYFRSTKEMEHVLGDFKEALENTVHVAEMCNVEFDFSKTHLPPFSVSDDVDVTAAGTNGNGATVSPEAAPAEDDPKGNDATTPDGPEVDPGSEPATTRERALTDEELIAYFRRLCLEGCRERYPDFDNNDVAKARLDYEMQVIEKMGYPSYFLITWDFVDYARKHDIPVGPGRGSAAGSIVAYALKITNVCPLKYDLLFERFLNSDRISMPDIDIDFCMDGRERVIDYVRRKYGEDRVSQIITFGTMAARAVLRDVGRALNVPLSEVDGITKKIPAGPGVELGESIEADPDLKKLRDGDPKIKELFDIALRLQGLNRHCSTHAAGVVISDAPLLDTVPLYRNGEDITTQFTMEDLELVGMLKMDFLGLRTLTIIDRCLKLLRKSQSIEVDIDTIPLDDQQTYDLLCRGDTIAVFQLESKGMRDLLRRLKPDRFKDIIAVIALYRPGPLEGGMVDSYIQRKHGLEEIDYGEAALESFLTPILEETNGVILYQEQVMRIANKLGGFTLNEADTLRKAMGKKKKELMEEFRGQFIDGAKANGIESKQSSHIFDLIEFFAGYGFNKSHSTAYALITYQTAYLKANFPTEFMAAVMTCEMSNTDKIVEYLEEVRHLDIEVGSPDIQRSETGFTVEGRKIWYGLGAVKGIGSKAVDAMVAGRQRSGPGNDQESSGNGQESSEEPYRSIFDLCERVDSQLLNKTVLESLISCGALDVFEQPRSRLHAVLESAISRGNEARKDRLAGQTSFFDLFDADATPNGDPSAEPSTVEAYPELPEWSDSERLSREKKTLGFYLSGHPLLNWKTILEQYATHTLSDIGELPDGTDVIIGTQIVKLTKKVSKRTNKPFWIALVEDLKGTLEIFVNQDKYEAAKDVFQVENLVFLTGKVRYRDTTPSLRLESALGLTDALSRLTRDLSVLIPLSDALRAEDEVFRVKDLLQQHRGSCPFYLVFRDPNGSRAILQVGDEHGVAPDADFFAGIEKICGQNRLFVNRMSHSR
jgi:DNA polymerase-3 subunit alpha